MGTSASKSPLERRNTVARRSQRRTIHNIKSKVDKVFQDIKKFKGIEEDVNYNALLSELEHIKNDLNRKSKELQPQVRAIHQSTLTRADEAIQALAERLKENQEKAKKKEEELKQKAIQKEEKQDKSKKKTRKVTESDEEEVVEEVHQHVEEEEEKEAANLAHTTEKRQTVELKFVQVLTPEELPQPELHEEIVRSPEEKRKSILKVGIPVMPGAMMNEISSKSKIISTHYNRQSSNDTSDNIISKVNDFIEHLQEIECQIADFVGRKNGTQYSRIRDKLNEYLIQLNQFNTNDEFVIEQIKLCRNYVGSCLNFLDEKAIDDRKYDSRDDVFLPENNNVVNQLDAQTKLQKLSKTTAI